MEGAVQHQFTAKLIKVSGMDGAFVEVPLDIQKLFGTRGQVKVKAWIDGELYRGSISSMVKNGPHILIVTQAVRKAIGKVPGDSVTVVLEQDQEPREVLVPEELAALLAQNAEAKAFFDSLAFTYRKEYAVWIASAKRPETRQNRLQQALERLLSGRKNPTGTC
jgi:hypothetical protein